MSLCNQLHNLAAKAMDTSTGLRCRKSRHPKSYGQELALNELVLGGWARNGSACPGLIILSDSRQKPFLPSDVKFTMAMPVSMDPDLSLPANDLPDNGRIALVRLEHLGPLGAYTVEVREAGAAVHCAFEKKADADHLASTVKARPLGHYSGWTTQRAFLLNRAAAKRIETAVGNLFVG